MEAVVLSSNLGDVPAAGKCCRLLAASRQHRHDE